MHVLNPSAQTHDEYRAVRKRPSFFRVDAAGRVRAVSKCTEQLFNRTRAEMLGAPLASVLPLASDPEFLELYRSAYSTGDGIGASLYCGRMHTRLDVHLLPDPDGLTVWVGGLTASTAQQARSVEEQPLGPEPSTDPRMLGSDDSRGELHNGRALQEDASLHDSLTRLPNRALLLQRLEAALAWAPTMDRPTVVVFFGLDRFKQINNSAGYAAGDRLLRAVAAQIHASLQPGDTLARVGDDEFAILRPTLAALNDIDSLVDRVREDLASGIIVDGQEVYVSAAAGVAVAAGDESADTLLAHAGLAMQQAKQYGSRRYHLYNGTMGQDTLGRLTLETDLRQAVGRAEIYLDYQPVVCLERGHIVGLEALARWTHPTRGQVEPDQFIRVAEQTGLIGALGEWVFEQAFRQAPLWPSVADAEDPLTISINISPRQFAERNLVKQIERLCNRTATDPRSIAVEITETILLDDLTSAADTLAALRALGVRIYMDDFGTGYSSLSYIARLPLDAIKIDRSFVQGMLGDAKNRQIIASIIGLASTLGVPTIAEGVETAEQLAELRTMGCRFGQGYLFSRPVSAASANQMLIRAPRW